MRARSRYNRLCLIQLLHMVSAQYAVQLCPGAYHSTRKSSYLGTYPEVGACPGYYGILFFSSIGKDEDESMVIDVTTHESEDETSSTSSASDGGCTSTSHKYEHAT